MKEPRSSTPTIPGQDVEICDASKLVSSPLVSVCMVTYNHAPYLRQALDSVLAQQTDFPCEICVGEDGSQDGTRDICLEYAARYPDKMRVFLRDRTNPARQKYVVPHAHNDQETFKACRGKYIAFLDGDDYWIAPAKLARQAAVLESNPATAMVAHYTIQVSEDNPWHTCAIPDVPMRGFGLETLLHEGLYVHISSIMVRRYDDIDPQIFLQSPWGDAPRLFTQLLHGPGLMLPQAMSAYRVHQGGVFSVQSQSSRIRQSLAVWEAFRPFVPAGLRTVHQAGLIKRLANATAECRRTGLRQEALEHFRRALQEIKAVETSSRIARLSWAADVLAGLLFPRLRGIHQRFQARLRSRRWGRERMIS